MRFEKFEILLSFRNWDLVRDECCSLMLKDFQLRCRHGSSVVETVALGSETVIVFTGDWLVEVLLEN